MRWHIAQIRAISGDTAEAIKYANSVLVVHEDFTKNPLRWNDYVLATIAFLRRDRRVLIAHRDEVARGKADYAGNALNLKLLDSLSTNFDASYKFATQHIGK